MTSQTVTERTIKALGGALLGGLAVGAFTAYGQGWLGDEVSSFANSAGPWSLAAFVLARRTRHVTVAIAAATIALVCCEFGYAAATEVRGGSNASSTVMFWVVAGLLAGPPLGVAAAWSHTDDWRRGAGIGVVGGVLIGEGTYGWTTVADTTDWRYWCAETVIGAAIATVAVVVAARSRRGRDVALAVAAVVATALVVVFTGRLA